MFITDNFLDQVKIKATLPPGRYEDDEILAVAYDTFLSQLVPLILNLKEEFYVASETQAIVANQAEYAIPYRSLGLMLREVKKVHNNAVINLHRIDPTDVTTSATGTPEYFYLEGTNVVIYPTPQSTDGAVVRLSYYVTPSQPVVTSDCALITAIDRNTGIITATPPTAWTSSNTFDFVTSKNGHKTLSFDVAATVGVSTLTFTPSAIPASLAVGDYIALSGQAPYFQMPDNAFALLVQLVANEFLENLGDQEALQVGLAKGENLKSTFVSSMSTRVLGEPKRSRIRL